MDTRVFLIEPLKTRKKWFGTFVAKTAKRAQKVTFDNFEPSRNMFTNEMCPIAWLHLRNICLDVMNHLPELQPSKKTSSLIAL